MSNSVQNFPIYGDIPMDMGLVGGLAAAYAIHKSCDKSPDQCSGISHDGILFVGFVVAVLIAIALYMHTHRK